MSTFGIRYRGSSKTPVRRKYLGDPSDPHFVPDSPIITRQSFTYEEEEELTRACTLVLSDVPHADEEDENPLMKYLSTQIPKPTRVHHQKDGSNLSKSSIGTGSELSNRIQKFHRINQDTVTPSVTSKRDTYDRTNSSTPMTILSETLRRPSSTRQNSGFRSESKCSNARGVYGVAGQTGAHEIRGGLPAAAKSMTLLPALLAAEGSQSTHVAGKMGTICISQLEFNKSLPNLPASNPVPTMEKQSRGVNRFFKASQKSKASTVASASVYGRPYEMQRAQTVPTQAPVKKSRFSFASLFDRRKRQQVTVL